MSQTTNIIKSQTSIPDHNKANNDRLVGTTSCLNKYMIKDDGAKAETIWALQTVMNHIPLMSSANCTRLFAEMFPDIAKKVFLQKDKLSYMIVHGLSPYFKRSKLSVSKFLVIGFDESLNKVAPNNKWTWVSDSGIQKREGSITDI